MPFARLSLYRCILTKITISINICVFAPLWMALVHFDRQDSVPPPCLNKIKMLPILCFWRLPSYLLYNKFASTVYFLVQTLPTCVFKSFPISFSYLRLLIFTLYLISWKTKLPAWSFFTSIKMISSRFQKINLHRAVEKSHVNNFCDFARNVTFTLRSCPVFRDRVYNWIEAPLLLIIMVCKITHCV